MTLIGDRNPHPESQFPDEPRLLDRCIATDGGAHVRLDAQLSAEECIELAQWLVAVAGGPRVTAAQADLERAPADAVTQISKAIAERYAAAGGP